MTNLTETKVSNSVYNIVFGYEDNAGNTDMSDEKDLLENSSFSWISNVREDIEKVLEDAKNDLGTVFEAGTNEEDAEKTIFNNETMQEEIEYYTKTRKILFYLEENKIIIAKKDIFDMIQRDSEIYLSAGEDSILNCISIHDEIGSMYSFDIQSPEDSDLYNSDALHEIIEKYDLEEFEDELIEYANDLNAEIITNTFEKMGYKKDNYETSQNYGAEVYIKVNLADDEEDEEDDE